MIAIVLIIGISTAFHFGLKKASHSVHVNLVGGAVAANGHECAEIGVNILNKGGSVADAAISTMLCEGVTCPQSTGLGGGFLMTIYIKSSGVVETLNAREVAPKKASQNMFVNITNAALEGGLSIAVPGEVNISFEYVLNMLS